MEQQEKVDAYEQRLSKLESLFEQHIVLCTKNSSDMKMVVEAIENVRSTMKVATFMRNAFVWVAGAVAAGIALYKSWKGM